MGVRSQNGPAVVVEKHADFFQARREFLCISVSQVSGEDQKIATFFDGSFGHIQEPSLVRFAATTESLSDVGGNGYGCSTHSEREAIGLLLGGNAAVKA
jgi:hypothetical protein